MFQLQIIFHTPRNIYAVHLLFYITLEFHEVQLAHKVTKNIFKVRKIPQSSVVFSVYVSCRIPSMIISPNGQNGVT